MVKVSVHLGDNSYEILIQEGALEHLDELLALNRKVLIVTDSGVPKAYAEKVASFCKSAHIVCVEQGEGSKSIGVWERLLTTLLDNGFTRKDAVVAVGGGVVGDLAGFTAASYMRGIDFYNIPTTLLAQVDSSVGGKTALNLGGIKNVVGAFYQPKKVIIDPAVLQTLAPRQMACGMAEAIKMAACFDRALFESLEQNAAYENLPEVIEKSIRIKADVVEKDEKEAGLRMALNFGHTIGHAIEANSDLEHGECVALGMLQMCSAAVHERLQKLLEKYALPTVCTLEKEKIDMAVRHDKKLSGGAVTTVYVQTPGSFEFKPFVLNHNEE